MTLRDELVARYSIAFRAWWDSCNPGDSGDDVLRATFREASKALTAYSIEHKLPALPPEPLGPPGGRWVFCNGMMTWLAKSDEAALSPAERDALALGTLGEQPFAEEDRQRDGCYASQANTTSTNLAPIPRRERR